LFIPSECGLPYLIILGNEKENEFISNMERKLSTGTE